MSKLLPHHKKVVYLALSTVVIGVIATIAFGQFKHKAPNVTYKIIDGSRITTGSLTGSPYLVNFWSTTCSVCIEELPELIRLYEDYRDYNFTVIGVSMFYDPPNKILEFTNKNKIPYPVALDIDKILQGAFHGISATPTTLLISADGTVLKRYVGTIPFDKIESKINKLLNINIDT